MRGKILKGLPEIIAVSKGDEHEKQLSYESNPALVFPYCSERGLLISVIYERFFIPELLQKEMIMCAVAADYCI